ncbi:MAG: inositol monophosphatase [Rhodospirillales bacterium]|nr:inositol monophosphatase [Rhodospirillales bacterium]
MSRHPDFGAVSDILREAAAEEIMPRFRHLSRSDVREKHPGDLVTTADLESEKRLTAALSALVPGSVVVGEEACESDPSRLKSLAGDGPVWLVDPVDGTANFAAGRPCFAVIAAYVVAGETIAGWIYDPVNKVMAVAGVGEGAWIGEQRLSVASPRPVRELSGAAPRRVRKRLEKQGPVDGAPMPASLGQYMCCGREYMDLARGELDFGRYGRRLKPWDHAAGILIHREAGGYSSMDEPERPYAPAGGIVQGALVAAPDERTWRCLKPILIDRH